MTARKRDTLARQLTAALVTVQNEITFARVSRPDAYPCTCTEFSGRLIDECVPCRVESALGAAQLAGYWKGPT